MNLLRQVISIVAYVVAIASTISYFIFQSDLALLHRIHPRTLANLIIIFRLAPAVSFAILSLLFTISIKLRGTAPWYNPDDVEKGNPKLEEVKEIGYKKSCCRIYLWSFGCAIGFSVFAICDYYQWPIHYGSLIFVGALMLPRVVPGGKYIPPVHRMMELMLFYIILGITLASLAFFMSTSACGVPRIMGIQLALVSFASTIFALRTIKVITMYHDARTGLMAAAIGSHLFIAANTLMFAQKECKDVDLRIIPRAVYTLSLVLISLITNSKFI